MTSGPKTPLSVIIAGGTGSTGRELVSKLVAHPRIGRVVVLSRYPIPVNRWSGFFPNLRTADALKHLSIVAVDWARIHHDTVAIPISLLSGKESIAGPSGQVENGVERKEESSQPRSDNTVDGASGRSETLLSRSLLSSKSGDPFSTSMTSSGIELPATYLSSSALINSASAKQIPSSRLARRTLHDIMRSAFYRSIFAGHHVAINCLGSHNFLSTRSVLDVDHDFAVAFAKLVRIFNCYTENDDTGDTEDEAEALGELARLPDDGQIWKEVCAAYFGKDGIRLGASNDRQRALKEIVEEQRSNAADVAAWMEAPSGSDPRTIARQPTLLQFSQVSTAGASSLSPLPYFRAHGTCDDEVLEMFNRSTASLAARRAARDALHGSHQDIDDHQSSSLCDSSKSDQSSSSFVNNTHLSIWKPGLLKRPNARWVERLLELVAPPVSVDALSGMILEDILASVEDKRDAHELGILKVVSAKHVSVWARLHGK